MGSGDDEAVWTCCDNYLIRRMLRYHDLNQNTTNVKLPESVCEMNSRQDERSPSKEITSWKFDNLAPHHNKISPNSNLHFKNGFFAEDTSSNDFFYDEEFAIPFDANLTEHRGSYRLPRNGIVTSKSDNCLYLGDLDQAESDREEPSGSENEMFSSSDSSGLFNQPLFSSHSECPDEFALDGSCDRDSVVDEDLPKDSQKSGHVKHHYKISFDRGPLKVWSSSDEPASKNSLEPNPIRINRKLSAANGKPCGNKRVPSLSGFPKSNNGARKSKKKSSQKSSMQWNSKSSHQVTWETIKNPPPSTQNDKSRTTWKEINLPSARGREEVPGGVHPTGTNAKSCHEINFNQQDAKGCAEETVDRECSAKSETSTVDKSCELFRIFQDKKLKEIGEYVDGDDLDEADNDCEPFCLYDEVREDDPGSPGGDGEFHDLQDIFENIKKPKSEKKLKFKSHSVDPNHSIQDPEKSPKIFQSANLASTNSTDSSVQTSLIISIPVKMENKSLQTSLTLNDDKQELSARDIWNTSSYLFSRPLPDLSFLKNSAKFLDAKVEVPPTKQHKSPVKEEAKVGKKSNPQNQNVRTSLNQTISKSNSKILSSSKTSQESSGRSKSSSTFSFHSSSSSGIDPGTSDSGRQSSSASSKDESLHSDTKDLSRTPPKPPRLFKAPPIADQTLKNAGRPGMREEVSRSQIEKSGDVCKEVIPKVSTEAKNARNLARGHHPTRRSPSNHDPAPANNGSKVVLRSNQPGYARPTKSILVRSRSKENRRSWSNNLPSESSQAGQHSSPRRRPLSVPDGTLLELTTPTQEEEKASTDNPTQPDMQVQEEHSTIDCNNKQHSKEDCVIATNDQDYEKFRAKKSVSFSETISYHPTSSSLSPLESPKSPINSVPTSPDTDAAQDDPKSPANAAQDVVDDVELPPNDFLVSPNVSPSSSSLSDSSNNLQPVLFDVQQKKDLVMDVMKAVEVVLKHINLSKEPLAKIKLCSTVDNPKIGNLLLEHLCPSIHAVILDGIKPTIPGLFGKVKSSACKVFEDSLEGSPSDSLNHLMRSMRDLKFLNNQWLKFNAYLFALLNLKVLDVWLASLRKNKTVLSRYYNQTSFLQLSNSGATCQSLFVDVVASLQPLSQIPFRLEYDFEINAVERKRQAFMAEQLLNKHVSCSSEMNVEAEKYLSRMHNALSFDSSALKASALEHPASSLCIDDRARKNSKDVDPAGEDNSESSIFLFWSTVDLGGFARGLLQKTQNKLMEKLSQSKDVFAFDGVSGSKRRSHDAGNPSPHAHKHPQSFFSFDSFTPSDRTPPSMVRSDCPRSYSTTARHSSFDSQNKVATNEPEKVVLHEVVTPVSPENSPAMGVHDLSTLASCREVEVTHNKSPPNQDVKLLIPPPLQKKSPQDPSHSLLQQKTQSSVLGSYGTKLVGVFDRLLLNGKSGEEKSFVIRKKYHSEDQISRHVINSPKNGMTMQSVAVLAKSVSCENGAHPEMSIMLASANSNRTRIARSLCHYVAMNSQFLSFEKDVQMFVVKEVGHDFFLCRRGDKEGLVYKVCISII